MIRKRRLWASLALLSSFALVASACGDDSESADEDPSEEPGGAGTEGGTLIWVHEQEPGDLHLDDPENNLTATSWSHQSMYDGLFGVSSETTFIPELATDFPEIVENEDGTFTLNYTLRDGLSWSDGEPLTTADVEFNYNFIVEGCATEADGSITSDGEGCVYLLGSRIGYDQITDFTVNSETEFSITFAQFFSGYPALFERVYPAHAFGEGAGAAEVNAALPELTGPNGILPASGPMVFESWTRGSTMELVRNENYHGSVSPEVENDGIAHVDGVQIQFVADTDTQVNALLAGEAHIIMTQPQTQFETLAESDDFLVESAAGPVYEHWGFNLLNPHLAKPEVREAIAFALDKGEVIELLYEPLFGDLLPTEGLGNTYWMSNQPAYEDHQSEYAGAQVDEARASLEAAGYVEGADGIYEHPTDGKLTLRVGTTGGNRLREDQQQIIQQQLADAGIDIVIDNVPGGDYFSERPFADGSVLASQTQGAEGDPIIWDIT